KNAILWFVYHTDGYRYKPLVRCSFWWLHTNLWGYPRFGWSKTAHQPNFRTHSSYWHKAILPPYDDDRLRGYSQNLLYCYPHKPSDFRGCSVRLPEQPN